MLDIEWTKLQAAVMARVDRSRDARHPLGVMSRRTGQQHEIDAPGPDDLNRLQAELERLSG
jgi:hypothetical protein